jgi:hypothetical protein
MTSKIKMTFERGGQVTATLLEEAAPETCQVVLKALPVEHEALHAMWAGEEIFFNGFPTEEDIGLENATADIEPGDIAYNAPFKSFCIFYGKSIPRSAVDQEIEVNVFAKADDVEELAKIGKRVRRQGIESVRIEAT